MGGDGTLRIRSRTPADLQALGRVLEEQRPHTGYPQTWPLRYPVDRFIARANELAAWVAELDGEVVGHVSVTRPGSGQDAGPEAQGWVAGAGRPLEDLAAVSVLFVDHRVSRRGTGRALLETAVAFIRSLDRVPVLDVVQESEGAVRLYLRNGWQVVGEARPAWLPEGNLPVLLMVLR
jgi:GNAT superfamily N-acetyltransferase